MWRRVKMMGLLMRMKTRMRRMKMSQKPQPEVVVWEVKVCVVVRRH
jgi:hypothetical protein